LRLIAVTEAASSENDPEVMNLIPESAVGLIDALDDAGLAVPVTASVVGYDNTAFAALKHIGLNTIDQTRNQMGRLAASMLLGSLTGDAPLEHVQMRPYLVVRTTTGRCPTG